MTISGWIMDLRSKLQREYNEAKIRLEALEHFPDLQEFQNIWKETQLISKSANELATKFEVRNECDCCSGAKIYALPYIEFGGIKIHTSPSSISFAKRWRNGILCCEDWEGNNTWMNEELTENLWAYIEEHEDKEEYNDLIGDIDDDLDTI